MVMLCSCPADGHDVRAPGYWLADEVALSAIWCEEAAEGSLNEAPLLLASWPLGKDMTRSSLPLLISHSVSHGTFRGDNWADISFFFARVPTSFQLLS